MYEVLIYSPIIMILMGITIIFFVMDGYKHRCLEKIITKKMVDKSLFSTLVVREFVEYLLKYYSKSKIIEILNQNKIAEVINSIRKPLLKAKMEMIFTDKIVAVKQQDDLYKMEQAVYWLKKQKSEKSVNLINEIKSSKKEIKALKKLILAQIALTEGDLETVSQEISVILPVFRHKKMLAEEAFAYYIMGTAYRITGVYDTADFMLREAVKIYNFLLSKVKAAESLGNLGLLMTAQHRFEEAFSYYKQAQEIITVKEHRELYYFIVSQQAMAHLLQKNFKEAELQGQRSLKGHRSNAGKSLATDVLSRIYFAEQKWNKSYKWSTVSAQYYLKEKNYASVFECWYLAAESLVGQNNFQDAEKLLRQVIEKEKYHKSCFYIANAYTLLGLVLLKKEDWKGAKAIFNQALKQEFYNERNTGIAIDYANLAAVERKIGNIKEARENLKKALIYAKDFDDDLYNKIKTILN